MSERPPAEDTQRAEGASPTADDALAAHLVRRGAHEPPRALAASILARVAETEPERRWRLTLVAWRPRLAIGVGGLTLVLLAALVLYPSAPPKTGATPAPPTPAGPPPLTISPTPNVAGLIWDPARRALTPPELLQILAVHPATGTVLIVDDQVVPSDPTCVMVQQCPAGMLQNDGAVYVMPPPGGHLPFASDPATSTMSIAGPVALEVNAGPNLTFLGSVARNGQQMAFSASDIARRGLTASDDTPRRQTDSPPARSATGVFVVAGWLWNAGVVPCPSSPSTPRPTPAPTSELGLPEPGHDICAGANYLTDDFPDLPIATPPSDGIQVQTGAVEQFASDRATDESQGVYLVREWGNDGEVLARLASIGIPPDDETGPTNAPPTEMPADVVSSVDDLVGQVMSGSFAVGSLVVASIPAADVQTLTAPGSNPTGDAATIGWFIKVGTRSLRVDVTARGDVLSPPIGIAGTQAFVVESSRAVRALGLVSTGALGAPLDGTSVGDGLAVVTGWLRIGPPIPCPAPPTTPTETGILGESLRWSQCPGTWILPSPDDPWAGPPNNVRATDGSGSMHFGDSSVPAGTLHVQDNADDPGTQPRQGIWLVQRVASTPVCPPGDLCALPGLDRPPPGATWWELVGPLFRMAQPVSPAPTVPSVVPSPVVLTQAQLVAGLLQREYRAGDILIAEATIAPVILSSPPEQGQVVGKIGRFQVMWASDPIVGSVVASRIALRVRVDGGLDYLGPVAPTNPDGPYDRDSLTSKTGLQLLRGSLVRSAGAPACVALGAGSSVTSFTVPLSFAALDGRRLAVGCGVAWIVPTPADPAQLIQDGVASPFPAGTLTVQDGDGPGGAPGEGLFLVRTIGCAAVPAGSDVCIVLRDVWEFVGSVFEPGP